MVELLLSGCIAKVPHNGVATKWQTEAAMKFRRHHNNKGYRQIKNGSLKKQINYIKRKLKIKPKPNNSDNNSLST